MNCNSLQTGLEKMKFECKTKLSFLLLIEADEFDVEISEADEGDAENDELGDESEEQLLVTCVTEAQSVCKFVGFVSPQCLTDFQMKSIIITSKKFKSNEYV